MDNTDQSIIQKKVKPPILIESLIRTLKEIQSKIDKASGTATAIDLRVRIIAQLEPKVQAALKKTTRDPFHKASLFYLIDSILEVFRDELAPEEKDQIKNCRPPRNKAIHGSLAELMIELSGEAFSREIDPSTSKRKPLAKDDIIEGAICIERNMGLDTFSQQSSKVIEILDEKILRSLSP